MYRKILFAIDDDEALPAATRAVAALARHWLAVVRVLHVEPVGHPPLMSRPRLVDEVVARLEANGVGSEGEVRLARHGQSVAEVVTGAAQEAEADLVVTGSHRRSELARAILGSVSDTVAAGLDVPVLVLNRGVEASPTVERVLVAVDGSAGSSLAVAEAGDIAASFAAHVVVLHVQPCIAADGGVWVEPDADARAIVDQFIAELRSRGLAATGENVMAYGVADAIVRSARRLGADLVVLGSRRPSAVGGLLAGSVAHEVIHRLLRPVLLARRASASSDAVPEPVGEGCEVRAV